MGTEGSHNADAVPESQCQKSDLGGEEQLAWRGIYRCHSGLVRPVSKCHGGVGGLLLWDNHSSLCGVDKPKSPHPEAPITDSGSF